MKPKNVLNYVPLGTLLLLAALSVTASNSSGEVSPVPQEAEATLAESEKVYKRSVNCLKYHKIDSGDTCWGMMNTYGLKLSQLQDMNNGINCDFLWLGREICVAVEAPQPPACGNFVEIVLGDTCYDIARQFGTNVAAIEMLNPGIVCNNLRIGQHVCVQGAARNVGFSKRSVATNEPPVAPKCGMTYTIKAGESCWSIANYVGLDVGALLKLNPTLCCGVIYPGQKICVADDSPRPSCPNRYIVKAGDTCFEIAQKHLISVEDLQSLNPGVKCDLLQIGFGICVPELAPKTQDPTPTVVASRSSFAEPAPKPAPKAEPKPERKPEPKTMPKQPELPKEVVKKPQKVNKCDMIYTPFDEMTCDEIAVKVGLQGVPEILALNPNLDCATPIQARQRVCVFTSNMLHCSQYHVVNVGDTEASLNEQFDFDNNVLKMLNQGKVPTSEPGALLCVQIRLNNGLRAPAAQKATPTFKKSLGGYFTNWDLYNTNNKPISLDRLSKYTHVMYSFMTVSYAYEYDTWYIDTVDPSADFSKRFEGNTNDCMEFSVDVQCEPGKVSLVPFLGAGAQEKKCPIVNCFNDGGAFEEPRQCHTELNVETWQGRPKVCGQINHVLNQLKKAAPSTAVMLTIGGWYDSNYWTKAVSPAYVDKFITSILSWINALPFDGLDINWEHPGYEHEGQKGPYTVRNNWSRSGNPDSIRKCQSEYCEEDRSKDVNNFAVFLEKLRKRLSSAGPNKNGLNRHGTRYELSIAVTGIPSIVSSWDISRICTAIDRVNLMTYDFNGGWSPRTDHQSALYTNGRSCHAASANYSVDCSVQFWVERGCPNRKIIVGVPTYARVLRDVRVGEPHALPGYHQKHSGMQSQKVVSYKEVLNDPSFVHYWDDNAKASFSYSSEKKEFATYDDEDAVEQKARFIKERGLGGAMFWSIGSHDPEDELIDEMQENL